MSSDFSRAQHVMLEAIKPDVLKRAAPYVVEVTGASLLDLQEMPDSLLVADDMERARSAFQMARGTYPENSRQYQFGKRAVLIAEARYADACRRDEIAKDRPGGCWCLGYGGRAPRYLPMPTGETYEGHDGAARAVIEETETLGEYCDCEDGKARKEDDDAIRAIYHEDRSRRAIIRRFGDAQLPPEYRSYPWRDHPDRGAVARVVAWMDDPKTGQDGKPRPDAHHWLVLMGPGGRGKTTLAAGMAAELTKQGRSVLFRPMPDLLDDIRATWGDTEEQEKLRQLLRSVRYLFLDDIGTEVPRDWIGDFLYALLNHRHNNHLPTIFTTNLDIRELGRHVGERIFERIKRMGEMVLMQGENLRDRPHAR